MAKQRNTLTGNGAISAGPRRLVLRRWLISVVLITAPVAGALCATKAMGLEVATLSAATPHASGSISAQRESRIDVPLEPSVTLAKSSVSIDRVRRCRPRSTC
jgi:hypothetical protein